MIKLSKIATLLELAFYTAYLKGEQPVSALLSAPPEAGKTEMLMRFANNDGIVVMTDCTAFGIMRDYGEAIRERKVRHLVIPDLVRPLSRGKDTVHSLIAFLNSLIEEGVLSISTYAEKIGVQGSDNERPIPVKCGLIATLAKEVLDDGRHHWSKMGFMSRLLPISYQYSPPTTLEIHKSIAKREYRQEEPIALKFPKEDVEISLGEPQATELMTLSTQMSGRDTIERAYGFRLQRHVQRLAMASAFKCGRERVGEQDVELLNELSSCVNLEYYPL